MPRNTNPSETPENFQLLDTLNEAPPYLIDVFVSQEACDGLLHEGLLNKDADFNSLLTQTLLPALELAAKALVPLLKEQEGIETQLGLSPLVESWEMDLTLVNDSEMQNLNQLYRHKNQPTDVLTFSIFAESGEMQPILANLPVIQLGSIFISMEWAIRESQKIWQDRDAGSKKPSDSADDVENSRDLSQTITTTIENVLIHYVTTRFVHGLLHLVGINHDSMEAYNKVVTLQNQVLHEVFGTTIQTIEIENENDSRYA